MVEPINPSSFELARVPMDPVYLAVRLEQGVSTIQKGLGLMDSGKPADLTALTVDLLAAFVANNNVRSEDLPSLIGATYQALARLGAPTAVSEQPVVNEHVGAVTSRKSLADRNVIVSMIDGKPYKSLKRHLTARGLSPEAYRARYNLPTSYPMVAPGYSEERRAVAKRLGLGRKRSVPSSDTPAASTAVEGGEPAPDPAKRKYTRRSKTADAAG